MAKKKQGGAKKSSSSKASKKSTKTSKKSTKKSTKSKSAKSTQKSTKSSKGTKEVPTKSMLQSMTKDDMKEYAEKFKIKLSTNDTKDEMVENFLDEYDDLEDDEPKKSGALTHALIPPHKKLSEKEKKQVQERYHVNTLQMPKINESDPAIQHMGAKEGDVIEITRTSQTAGEIKFYRSVVRD